MRETSRRHHRTRVRFTRRRLSRLRWPLGLALVALLPWLPVAIVLCNYLPLPAAPHPILAFFASFYLPRTGEYASHYVLNVGPLAMALTAALWLARRHTQCREPVAAMLRWTEAAIQWSSEPLVRHGAAILLWLSFAFVTTFGLSLCPPLDWSGLFAFPLALLSVALVAVPVAAATRWRRGQWAQATVVAGLLLLGGHFQCDALGWLEDRHCDALAARAEPLCVALDRYTADHGRAPASLGDLVPTYLPAVPGTRWACCPRFEYQTIAYRVTWWGSHRIGRMDFGADGDHLGLYPCGPDTLRQAVAAFGVPLWIECDRHWQLRVALPDRRFDPEWLLTKDGWSGQRHGRWRYIAW